MKARVALGFTILGLLFLAINFGMWWMYYDSCRGSGEEFTSIFFFACEGFMGLCHLLSWCFTGSFKLTYPEDY